MKRFLFTMMTLVALVLVANTTFAAPGDQYEPFVGTSQTYSIAGLVNADGYELWITTSATAPDLAGDAVDDAEVVMSAASNGGTVNGTNAYASGTVASNAAGVTVAWGEGATSTGNPDYYLWIRITTGDGCTNYRYKGIDVNAYFVDFTIAANGPDNTHVGDGSIVCQVPTGTEYNTDGPADDGTVKHYFTVTRTPNVGGINSAWTLTLSVATDLANQTIAYGTAAGTYGTSITDGSSFTVSSGTNVIYVEVTGDAYTSADLAATMTISGAQDNATHTDDDDTHAAPGALNTATNNFYRLPAIGAFN